MDVRICAPPRDGVSRSSPRRRAPRGAQLELAARNFSSPSSIEADWRAVEIYFESDIHREPAALTANKATQEDHEAVEVRAASSPLESMTLSPISTFASPRPVVRRPPIPSLGSDDRASERLTGMPMLAGRLEFLCVIGRVFELGVLELHLPFENSAVFFLEFPKRHRDRPRSRAVAASQRPRDFRYPAVRADLPIQTPPKTSES